MVWVWVLVAVQSLLAKAPVTGTATEHPGSCPLKYSPCGSGPQTLTFMALFSCLHLGSRQAAGSLQNFLVALIPQGASQKMSGITCKEFCPDSKNGGTLTLG